MIKDQLEICTLLLCSFRYALGRKTYIVNEVCELLIKYKDWMTTHLKKKICSEIQIALDRNDVGMDCDRKEWLKVKNELDT